MQAAPPEQEQELEQERELELELEQELELEREREREREQELEREREREQELEQELERMRHTFLNSLPAGEAWRRVLAVLLDTDFSMSAAARRLGVSRAHLYTWLRARPTYLTRLSLEKRRHFARPL